MYIYRRINVGELSPGKEIKRWRKGELRKVERDKRTGVTWHLRGGGDLQKEFQWGKEEGDK